MGLIAKSCGFRSLCLLQVVSELYGPWPFFTICVNLVFRVSLKYRTLSKKEKKKIKVKKKVKKRKERKKLKRKDKRKKSKKTK